MAPNNINSIEERRASSMGKLERGIMNEGESPTMQSVKMNMQLYPTTSHDNYNTGQDKLGFARS